MKVLAIITSLRKRNTYELVQRFEKAHKQYNESCDYEYVFIKDMNLELCKGCFVCISKGEDRCPLKDDRDLLIDKIEAADCIVLAGPNYAANVNWLTKNLIDRMAYNLHRPMYFDKKFVMLMTSGNFMGVKQSFNALAKLVSGGQLIGKIVMYTAPELGEKQRLKQDRRFDKESNRIFKSLEKSDFDKVPFANLMWFASFKATHDLYQSTLPADYEYYKNKTYFTNKPLTFVQNSVISSFARVIRLVLK